MSLIFYWLWKNYFTDIVNPLDTEDHLNQNSELIHELKTGEHIWAFTRRPDKTYVLAADLVVARTATNPPGYKYGRYRAWGDKGSTRYFDVCKGSNIEPLISSLSITTNATVLGQSFQGSNGVKLLRPELEDEQKLLSFSSGLTIVEVWPQYRKALRTL